MHTTSKTICAAVLGMALLLTATTSASAQSFGGRMSTKEKATYIGGAGAAGAIIGGLLGGKKGAVIGGLLGAGGGAGYVYYKGRKDDRYDRYYGQYPRGYRDQRVSEQNRRFDSRIRDERHLRHRNRWSHDFNR
jgi:uncharacterized membrane protein YebE (DUF533 family)